MCGAGQAELDKGVQRERALAEAEGRARENRENEDINRRALAQRLEEERKKVVEAIDTTFRCRPALPWQQAGRCHQRKRFCRQVAGWDESGQLMPGLFKLWMPRIGLHWLPLITRATGAR